MKNNIKIFDCIIVGSGISGVSFAHFLKKQNPTLNIAIIEEKNFCGGSFNTFTKDDFQLEMAAHTCYNSYANLISILDDIQLTSSLIKRKKLSFKLFDQTKNKLIPIIKKLNFIELFISLPFIFFTKKENQTTQSFYQKVLGKHNYTTLFKHAFNAVLSQDSSLFPAEILFKKRPIRRKDIAKSFSINGGLSKIIHKILTYNHIEIVYNTSLKSIIKKDDLFILNDEIQAKKICLSTPVSNTYDLLTQVDKRSAAFLKEIQEAHIKSISLIFNKDDIKIEEIAGIISLNDNFFSAISSDSIPTKNIKLRGFTFYFKGKQQNNKIADPATIDYICNILNVSRDKIQEIKTNKTKLPSLTIQNINSIRLFENSIKQNNNIFICGNYFLGLAIEDCVTRSKQESNRFFADL